MKFRFSGNLIRFVDYTREVEVQANTLGGALSELVTRYPSLRQTLYDGENKLRAAHRLFLNGDQLLRPDPGTDVAQSDCVDILTAITGG